MKIEAHTGGKELGIKYTKIKIILCIGCTCKGLREALSNLLFCLFCVAEGRVKSHPTKDAGAVTIFAIETKTKVLEKKVNEK